MLCLWEEDDQDSGEERKDGEDEHGDDGQGHVAEDSYVARGASSHSSHLEEDAIGSYGKHTMEETPTARFLTTVGESSEVNM